VAKPKREVPDLQVGDWVSWESQARGGYRKKTGEVVAIVPAGRQPSREDFPQLYRGPGVGLPRAHASYVVKVTTGKRRRSFRVYWPVANRLVKRTGWIREAFPATVGMDTGNGPDRTVTVTVKDGQVEDIKEGGSGGD